MNECIFCKIIKGELPSTKVFENEEYLAIVPIDQVSKGHTLLIPKAHFENIFDIDQTCLEKLAGVSKNLAIDLVDKNQATGINLVNANGLDAQQSVFHFHLHLVPRYPNDGLDLWFKNNL